jgi:hypothetical protein
MACWSSRCRRLPRRKKCRFKKSQTKVARAGTGVHGA